MKFEFIANEKMINSIFIHHQTVEKKTSLTVAETS